MESPATLKRSPRRPLSHLTGGGGKIVARQDAEGRDRNFIRAREGAELRGEKALVAEHPREEDESLALPLRALRPPPLLPFSAHDAPAPPLEPLGGECCPLGEGGQLGIGDLAVHCSETRRRWRSRSPSPP